MGCDKGKFKKKRKKKKFKKKRNSASKPVVFKGTREIEIFLSTSYSVH